MGFDLKVINLVCYPIFVTQYFLLNIWYPIYDSRYLILYIWYLIFDTWYLKPDIWYLIFDTQYLILNIRYPIFDTSYFILNKWYPILDSHSIISYWPELFRLINPCWPEPFRSIILHWPEPFKLINPYERVDKNFKRSKLMILDLSVVDNPLKIYSTNQYFSESWSIKYKNIP